MISEPIESRIGGIIIPENNTAIRICPEAKREVLRIREEQKKIPHAKNKQDGKKPVNYNEKT